MGSLSIWHWLIVLVVVLILFGGRGKIPELMGDFAKGHQKLQEGHVRRRRRDARRSPSRTRPTTRPEFDRFSYRAFLNEASRLMAWCVPMAGE